MILSKFTSQLTLSVANLNKYWERFKFAILKYVRVKGKVAAFPLYSEAETPAYRGVLDEGVCWYGLWISSLLWWPGLRYKHNDGENDNFYEATPVAGRPRSPFNIFTGLSHLSFGCWMTGIIFSSNNQLTWPAAYLAQRVFVCLLDA